MGEPRVLPESDGKDRARGCREKRGLRASPTESEHGQKHEHDQEQGLPQTETDEPNRGAISVVDPQPVELQTHVPPFVGIRQDRQHEGRLAHAREVDRPLLIYAAAGTEAINGSLRQSNLDFRRLRKISRVAVGDRHRPAMDFEWKRDCSIVGGPVGRPSAHDLVVGMKSLDVGRVSGAEAELDTAGSPRPQQ